MLELKKIIRNIIKNEVDSDLEKHIYIIKNILFFISRVILINKNRKLNIEDIAFKLEQGLNDDIIELLIGIEHIKKHETCVLNNEQQEDMINALNLIEHDNLINISLGELYDYFTTANEKKLLGQVYTPRDIVKEMVNDSFSTEDIISNPYFKVIDPACGGGYFISEVYEKLRDIIIKNYRDIAPLNSLTKSNFNQGIHEFILKHNIYATDIDDFAIYMTRFSLFIKGNFKSENIFKLDSLLDSDELLREGQFDLVISNPPYIGHKKVDKTYRYALSKKYNDVYSDKGDISFCFFKKGYSLLKDSGKLLLITSRYFLESPSGKDLRNFLNENFAIEKIIDFYGQNVFKGIGISPVIIELIKDNIRRDVKVYKRLLNIKTDSFNENINLNFEKFFIKQDNLDTNGWILHSEEAKKLYDKINSMSKINLNELCIFNQGVITGYDKAFIINEDELKSSQYETDLIEPWIKNSEIDKYYLKEIKKYIIYTDKIDNEEDYPYILDRVVKYKDRLSNRRECKKNIRKWYELQWGREETLFKSEKIMFPYKAEKNKFAIVREEIYSSADVYILTIKEEHKDKINLEYLVAFLNSKICEFYFKCIAKKLNDKLYEYYPNKLINLNIKLIEDSSYIESLVKKIETSHKEQEYLKVRDFKEKIDKYFYKIYGLNKNEINLIESYFDI